MRFRATEKGRGGPIVKIRSKYSSSLSRAAISDFVFWIFIHLFSVNAHLLRLDIYSLDIWPLKPNIFIHLMRKYVRSLDLYNIYLFGPRLVPTFVIAAIVWLLGP